jgi:hypothetical protein
MSDGDVAMYKVFYAPTHLNIGNYVIGAIAGLIYYKHKQAKSKEQKVNFVSRT